MHSRSRIFVPLLFAAVAIFSVLLIQFSSRLRRDITHSLMAATADRAETALQSELTRLFDPIGAQLAITERWGERGLLDVADHETLNTLFMPMLGQVAHVSSMLIADETGHEYMLLRDDDTWQTRAIDVAEQPGRVRWQRWADEDSLIEESWADLDYDPRERPWYQAALSEEQVDERGVAWTRPYQFFTTGKVGITLSKRWRAGNPARTFVSGFDVPLESILPVVEGLVEDGTCFLFNLDDQVISAEGEAGVRPPQSTEAGILAAWRDAASPEGVPFSVDGDGRSLWADVRPLSPTEGDMSPHVAIVIAESALDGLVRGQQRRYMLLALGVLALGALVTLPLTQLLGRRRIKVRDLQSEAGLLTAIAHGESDQLEFKATMRWNLRSDKPGKEVEMSWLKTVVAFMNTDGGAILIGVSDDGDVAGIEADRFANEDKFMLHFNNLINEHVGLAYSRFIRANLRSVRRARIFVIECRPATDPAFLKKGNEELFYIRVGPSSRQLPPSEVVKRFRGRG